KTKIILKQYKIQINTIKFFHHIIFSYTKPNKSGKTLIRQCDFKGSFFNAYLFIDKESSSPDLSLEFVLTLIYGKIAQSV
ncbi:MAG: hypothetical protein ACTHJ2_09085, partial [Candidatus Nitrosocosmicus sp.]